MRRAIRIAVRKGTPVEPEKQKPNMGSRWAGFVLRRPLPLLLLSVIGLRAIAVPVTHMRLGEAGNAILPTSSTERRAYDDISHAFGPGYNGQLALIVTAQGTADPKSAATEVAAELRTTPGVATSASYRQTRGEPQVRSLPPGTDLAAYRIIQEALTNITKHSAATEAGSASNTPPTG